MPSQATSYTTYREYLSAPEFRASVSAAAKRAGWRCEQCGKVAKLHPHHVRYCRWGEFDPPENLKMLCHACHAKAHTCAKCGRITLKAFHIKRGLAACCSNHSGK